MSESMNSVTVIILFKNDINFRLFRELKFKETQASLLLSLFVDHNDVISR